MEFWALLLAVAIYVMIWLFAADKFFGFIDRKKSETEPRDDYVPVYNLLKEDDHEY